MSDCTDTECVWALAAGHICGTCAARLFARAEQAEAIIGQCHEALGEAAESDDETLPEGIALHVAATKTLQARASQAEAALAGRDAKEAELLLELYEKYQELEAMNHTMESATRGLKLAATALADCRRKALEEAAQIAAEWQERAGMRWGDGRTVTGCDIAFSEGQVCTAPDGIADAIRAIAARDGRAS